MTKLLILLSSILFLCSCKDNPIDLSYKEVMKIHDEVMPLMSNIHNLRKKISEIPTENDTIATKTKLILQSLEEADENMMIWMAEFSMPKSESEHMGYLKTEKVKIQKVSDNMHFAIAKAEEFLNK